MLAYILLFYLFKTVYLQFHDISLKLCVFHVKNVLWDQKSQHLVKV